MLKLTARNLTKRFGSRKVFSSVDIEVTAGDSLAVVGPNGSGKTTLLMTLLGLYRPTSGCVDYTEDNARLDRTAVRSRVAFVAPYLSLYDQLSGEENLTFFCTVVGGVVTGKEVNRVLARVGLEGRGNDLVGEYSSGMKQRLRYALALVSEPDFLFLDEPTANLDRQGKDVVFGIIEEHRLNRVIVIAANEKEEYSLAGQQCRLGQ